MKTEWYDVEPPDSGVWWWAVEHQGHPAFFLRTLMPGDFGPGRLPLSRHVRSLEGEEDAAPDCGTCGETPEAADLEIIERRTGAQGFLDQYRSGRARWPTATPPGTCWLCCDRTAPAVVTKPGPGGRDVALCAGCAHLVGEG